MALLVRQFSGVNPAYPNSPSCPHYGFGCVFRCLCSRPRFSIGNHALKYKMPFTTRQQDIVEDYSPHRIRYVYEIERIITNKVLSVLVHSNHSTQTAAL
jgi:hypothetical protein